MQVPRRVTFPAKAVRMSSSGVVWGVGRYALKRVSTRMATWRILLTTDRLGLKQGIISSVAALQKLRFRRQMPWA